MSSHTSESRTSHFGVDYVKNIWEICKFSDEIESGNLDLHKFAVELHDVTSGNADTVYQDPKRFLDNTYLTVQMKSMLKDTLNRIIHSRGIPVTIIDTGFGGGKTHTLMLLYHIFSNPKLGLDYIKEYGLDTDVKITEIPNVRVVAIDCRDIKRNTLWGEIADRLGKYDTAQDYDKTPRSIGNLDIIRNFFDKPTLLMIDELPHYLTETLAERIEGTNKSKITEAFLYKLISVASSSKNTAFVLTLTENQQLYKERVDGIKNTLTDYVIDDAIGGLKETLSRQTTTKNPVQKEEIYDVIRHRLIRQIDKEGKKSIVEEYANYYSNHDLVTDQKFLERLEKSYPIHPELVDMLYDRVSTISKFNQTRGTLRFLALVLHDIYKNKRECALVTTGDVNLESSVISDEVTSKIDRNEFKKIIDTDCIDHACEIDNQKHIKITESVARTIYLHSLHDTPNKKSGIAVEQIKRSIGMPGLDTSLVEKTLYDEIMPSFWYIKENNNQFYFVNSVNENAIIAEYAKSVSANEMDEQIRQHLEHLTRTPFKAKIWDENIEDSTSLKLCLFRYDISHDSIKNRMSRILEYTNTDSPRTNQNTIVFTYADKNRVADLKMHAKELVAILKAKKDERIRTDSAFVKNISKKESIAKGNLESTCVMAYNHICYPDGPEPRCDVMSYSDMSSQTIGDMVREFLCSKGKLIPELGCDAISVDTYKKLEDIYNGFLHDKRKKFVENMGSIKDAVVAGVERGIFGYAPDVQESKDRHTGVILKQIDDIRFSGYIINKELLEVEEPKSKPPAESQIDTHGSNYVHDIQIKNIDEVVARLEAFQISDDLGDIQKTLDMDVDLIGNTQVKIKSSLGDIDAVKKVINNLRSYQNGECNVILRMTSANDMSELLREHDLE